MLEKVGIIVAFLISLTVLTINSLTIVEKIRNLEWDKQKEKAYTQAAPTKETTPTYTPMRAKLKGNELLL
ncbi:hypothetical protein [Bacillus phage SPbetaL3]|nr:hypothetical protein [Bacillus phage SPbetaL3]